MINDIVIIRGGGDLATGIAHKIYRSGFKILMLEIEKPLVIRRTVAFAQAIYDGQTIVEDVKAVKVESVNEVYRAWEENSIPVMVDPQCKVLNQIKADVLVDAIIAKKNIGTNRDMAPITIGVGPGFNASVDVDVVIETKRGHDLGRLIFKGYAQENTGIPGEIMGYSIERVLKSPASGKIKNILQIGDMVKKGDVISYIEDTPLTATIDGVLRGLIADGLNVSEGLKIGDIDPRGIKEYCFTISDKARTIGGGVLEAILYMKSRGSK
jgi:xanthine dehydrogenase accessory factor